MKRSTFPAVACSVVVTALLSLSGAVFAGTVVLKDGTIIRGEVESLQDGVYTVDTDSLGRVRVRKEEVRSIESGEGSAAGPAPGPGGSGSKLEQPDAQAVESRIGQDPQLLATLLALQNDPDVLAVMGDPEIMKAIAAGDYTALMNNPKMMALMNNPKLREIIDALRQPSGAPAFSGSDLPKTR